MPILNEKDKELNKKGKDISKKKESK